MEITKSDLLRQLRRALTDSEWTKIARNSELAVSRFNRGVLMEMKTAAIPDGAGGVSAETVDSLYNTIKDYLAEHMSDKPEGLKWIVISCLYLTFIAERPMHPIELLDIKETTQDGVRVYECPSKSSGKNTTCQYCVCKRMSNYEIMKRQMQKEFLKYDQNKMIQKFGLQHDADYIFINFIGRRYRVSRTSGKVEWSDDGFATLHEAGYNEAMTIYDVLCYSKDDCATSGAFINMHNLSSVQGGSISPGSGLFQKSEESFDNKDEALAQACEKLNGTKYGKGDVAYKINMFDFLPVVFQFWDSDDEFPASLNLLADKNMLDYMHFETVWFAVSHLITRLREEMERAL